MTTVSFTQKLFASAATLVASFVLLAAAVSPTLPIA